MGYDTKGALKDAIRKLLQDTSVAKGDWVLEASEDIDLESLLPYMKTYFALPYRINDKRQILFVTDKKRYREYASAMLKGYGKDIFEIEPYWLRFCMREVLESTVLRFQR